MIIKIIGMIIIGIIVGAMAGTIAGGIAGTILGMLVKIIPSAVLDEYFGFAFAAFLILYGPGGIIFGSISGAVVMNLVGKKNEIMMASGFLGGAFGGLYGMVLFFEIPTVLFSP